MTPPDICLVSYARLPENTNKLLDFLPLTLALVQLLAALTLASCPYSRDWHQASQILLAKVPRRFRVCALFSRGTYAQPYQKTFKYVIPLISLKLRQSLRIWSK